jgi:hypothetical protein
MGIKVANNAFATLASGITSSATSITVASGQGARFPILGALDYFYATLINTSNQLEIVKCTARSGDVLTVVRAQEGTTARAYDVGDRIEIRITAATFIDAAASVVLTTTVAGSSGTSDWTQASSSDPWIATKTVAGILSTDHPIVDIDLSAVALADVFTTQNEWSLVYRVEASDDDEIKLYATAEPAPTFSLQIKVVR